jgi:Tfp pilus assembly protein PilF
MKTKGLKSKIFVNNIFLRHANLYVSVIVYSVIILFTGCNNQQTTQGPVKVVSTQDRKTQLLKSLDKKFEDPKSQYELGRIYHSEGKWSDAEWRYNQALTMKPGYREAQAAMVKLFIDSHDTAKSKNYASIYMQQVSANADQSLELAMAYQELELDQYALACYDNALRLAPNSANVHRQLGFYYLKKNDKQKAKEHLIQSYQLYPNQSDVAYELGKLDVTLSQPQETKKPK